MTSNRDGIGSRVTVWQAGNDRPIVRTLHAGDAFLSQSSKWLHFGLGANQSIARIEVRWPNGVLETFKNVTAGKRHILIEGTNTAQVLSSPSRTVKIRNADPPNVESNLAIRTVLSNRIPLPIMQYKTVEGEKRTLRFTRDWRVL